MGSWVVPGYTEVRELSPGGTGRLMLAWHDPTGTPVAIRYLDEDLPADDELRRAFRAEVLRLSEVDSPHVIRYHEYVESADGSAIVMELVDGVSLRAILDEGGPLDPLAAAVVLKDSLLGLAAAHARGVLHRDQRPEHVLVDTEGRAKLIEFGLPARALADRSVTVHTDLAAVAATYRVCLAGSAAPLPLAPPRDSPSAVTSSGPIDAQAVLAHLTAAARDAHGLGWEAHGREALAARAARLLRVSAPPNPPAPPAPARRWNGRVLVGVAVALVVAAAFASLVTR